MDIDVTLLMFDCGENVDRTVRTINRVSRMMPFRDVRCFLHKKPAVKPDCDWWIMPDTSYFIGKGKVHGILPLMFNTSHVLYIQNDGYILNPHLWDNEWLHLDYVSPPWPDHFKNTRHYANAEQRVGCGGFCLKSKSFCENVADLLKEHDLFHPVDVAESNIFYSHLIARGMKYADIHTALRFGKEWPIEEYPDWKATENSFGFHDYRFNKDVTEIP